MGIRIDYTPAGAAIGAAYATGVGKAKERQSDKAVQILQQNEQRRFQAMMQKDQQAHALDLLGERNKFFAEQGGLDREHRAGLWEDRDRRVNERADFEWNRDRERERELWRMEDAGRVHAGTHAYTPGQEMSFSRNRELLGELAKRVASGEMSQEEYDEVKRQVEDQEAMNRPMPVRPGEEPIPYSERIKHDTYTDPDTGDIWTSDPRTGGHRIVGNAYEAREESRREEESRIFSWAEMIVQNNPALSFAQALKKAEEGYKTWKEGREQSGGAAPATGNEQTGSPGTVPPTAPEAATAAGEEAPGYEVDINRLQPGDRLEKRHDRGNVLPTEQDDPTRMQEAVAQHTSFGRLNPEQQQRTAAYFEALDQLAQAQEAMAVALSEDSPRSVAVDSATGMMTSANTGKGRKQLAAEKVLKDAQKRKAEAWRNLPSEAQAELIRRETASWETKL